MRISDWSSDVCSSDLDFISVPAGVYRDFRNVGTDLGRLLVAIQTPPDDTQDTVVHAPAAGAEIVRRFGRDTLDAMRSEERRVGKECVSTGRSRWSPYH